MNTNILWTVSIIVVILIIVYYLYNAWQRHDLKCIVSTVNGKQYCVRDRVRPQEAVDLLAKTVEKCKQLVKYVSEKYPEEEFCQQLARNFRPEKVEESLPTSTLTAYTENKGESMAFCLNVNKSDNTKLIDENTLTFVAIHEVTHCGTTSIGHSTTFWQNFKFLLEEAKQLGVYNPVDYKASPKQYCGIELKDNPYYDL